MRRFLELLLSVVFALSLTTFAFAHAFLDHATPAVGSSVQGSPGELELTFTQNIVAGFSGISLKAEGGASVPLGKPSISGN
ncbi:MAG TPA: copper resistance protein CopC, partial [Methylovirgula sp.]